MPRSITRKIRVYFNEIVIKLGQFRGSFFWFLIVVMIGATILRMSFGLGWIEAIYQAITLMFFATDLDYPRGNLPLEIMWISYPIVALLIILDGLSGIGQAIKFGDTSSEEWNEEMSKVMDNHVIIVGIGNLGVRVLNELSKSSWDLVIIDKFEGEHHEIIREYQEEHRVPVIRGDATLESNLKKANIGKARAIMVLIDDDLLNIKIAMKARKLNPKIHITLRIFDTEFGRELSDELDFSLFSTTQIAVNSFVEDLNAITSS